ncbi:LacI family DNA-binding transcriptional regulator [Amycolatopsis jiangsuensis]|uniref:LacI family transcriptional regulator n=1 Tax=Amycolatopsis jiangsuensis TaxID=1181879 RepID=A0A840IM99_9PSEU|nr:LacI family DNA-binding transcriptional regulator [Amycolatopsis jiangsuensis]MBB4683456.1 LacI family transcriptional regulator [Amycolatopsis jiangsuensis]
MPELSLSRRSGGGRSPTSRDIARELDVSQSTVSRALNGGSVAEATRARVIEAAARRGYVVNAAARELVTKKSGLVGVVVADITNPFYPELVEAIGARLAEAGKTMLLATIGVTDDEVARVRLLLEHRVDGIIFTSTQVDSTAIPRLASDDFPLVLVNREVDGVEADAIVGDNVAGATAAAEYLLGLGHRRIALITGDARTSTSRDREAAFVRSLEGAGVRLAHRVEAGFDQRAAFSAALELLGGTRPPTAVMCVNDLIAFGVLNAARRLGIDVPGGLSVVGFDDIPMASWDAIGLTTVRQPISRMAEEAVAVLERRVADDGSEFERHLLPCELVVRSTTGVPGTTKGKV